jgi:hypothetical protein
MNKELETLILSYESVSALMDTEAEQALQVFEAQLRKNRRQFRQKHDILSVSRSAPDSP